MLVRVRLWLWWMLPINGVWWMLVLGSLTLMNACYDCVVDNKFVRYMSNHLYSTRMKALKSSSLSFHLETYFFCFLSSFPVFKPLLSLFLFILKLISSASSLLSHTRIWILEINLVRHPILLICWTVNKILTFLKPIRMQVSHMDHHNSRGKLQASVKSQRQSVEKERNGQSLMILCSLALG